MAAVTSLSPQDGAVNVPPDMPVVALIEDASGIDVALVEIVVAGVTCTVANGLLTYWNHRRIVGGAQVNDWTTVYFAAAVPWFTTSSAIIDVTVNYDGSPLTTASFRASDLELGAPTGQGRYEMWAEAADWLHGRAPAWYCVIDTFASATEQVWFYLIDPPPGADANGWYYIGHYEVLDAPAALIAGALSVSDVPSAMTVFGVTVVDGKAAHLVQSWGYTEGSGALLPARVTMIEPSAAYVGGVTTLRDGATAHIVYTVNRGTVVEVRSVTPETAAFLAALGVRRD